MADINFFVSTASHVVLAINVILIFLIKDIDLRQKTQTFKLFLIVGLIIQIVAKVLWVNSMNNLPLLHIYTLFEFVLLSLFYRGILELAPKWERNFNGLILLFSLLIILNTLYLQAPKSFNSYSKTLVQACIMGYAILYLFRILQEPVYSPKRRFNLLNAGILVYYAGSLFIFMFGGILTTDNFQIIFWVINSAFYLGFQLLITYWIWTAPSRQMKSI